MLSRADVLPLPLSYPAQQSQGGGRADVLALPLSYPAQQSQGGGRGRAGVGGRARAGVPAGVRACVRAFMVGEATTKCAPLADEVNPCAPPPTEGKAKGRERGGEREG